MNLRPHHILDIISRYGKDLEFTPHPYGNLLYEVANQLISDIETKIKLVVDSDEVCTGCKYLNTNGKCEDVLAQLTPPPSKQAYNDVLDCRLLDFLAIEENSEVTLKEYLKIVDKNLNGIEKICTHPKEDEQQRLFGLTRGLEKLGLRQVCL